MYDDVVAVVENRPFAGGHFLLSVHAPRQAQATRPGQFAMVRLLGRSDVLLRRPMSIYDVQPAGSAGVSRAPLGGHTLPAAPVSPAAIPAMRTSPLQQAGGRSVGKLRPPRPEPE